MAITSPDVTDWSTMIVKTAVGLNLRGAFAGDGNDCCLRISAARNDTADLNAGTFIQATLCWGATGTSTLKWQEWAKANAAGVTGTPDRDIDEQNIKIQGLAVPTDDNDAATKLYVDSKVNNMLDIKDPVQTVSDGNQTGVTYDDSAGTLVINTNTATNFSNANDSAGQVDCGNYTLDLNTANKRILIRGIEGAAIGTGDDADGVYDLTAVVGNNITLTRSAGLSPPLVKGLFVLCDGGGADAQGFGYVLNADVSSATDPQPWILFSSQQDLNFISPIEYVGSDYTVAGASDGSEQYLPLVAGDGVANGVASFSATIGKSTNAFAVHGSNVTISDAGNFNINANSDVTITAPTSSITANTSLILDSTGGTSSIYGNSIAVAKQVGGTDPHVNFPTYTEAKSLGSLTPTTSQFAVASDETIGNGILFNTKSDFVGTNSNEGVFYMAPHYAGGSATGTGSISLDILKFATGSSGAGSVIAQIIPP